MPDRFHRYPCPTCSAELVFEPRDGFLTCPFCGRKEPIPQDISEINEQSYEKYLRPSETRINKLAPEALEVTCQGCSATVTFTPPQIAGSCPFCGNQIIAQPKSANPLVAPEAILPFSINQQQSDAALKKWLVTRWFAPNALYRLAYREGTSGIYLPFWTFDANSLTAYTGERGEHYFVTEEFTENDAQGNPVRRIRRVQKTNWFAVSGQVEHWFNDVLVAATKSINRDRLMALEPWDLPQLQAYNPAFIAGFKAQRYEVELSEGFETAKHLMTPKIYEDSRNDIGGDEQRVLTITTQHSGITFKHILLPVYLGAYKFNQKTYQIMINARTGTVQGDRPYSYWKIFFLFLAIIALSSLIVLFATSGKR